ncbi:MAG: hypothetical protein A3H98_10590 [Bacteroidetes bacterium RIFCSPLOWO2_02_FULL_36_8]|nr:MAG: hypothetical protein A3H98_10590 [Bacteroidetes bacterium RIFCSPLOWO2_02_FULL_36_8]OFY70004.1 MAG: hypothetical protein A3G23_01105 [Bacteroidetes bacterium RIFCSPLOWO2_12_FULL_37_12]
MKKSLIIISFLSCFPLFIYSQPQEVTNAIFAYNEGEYDKAKEYIDRATVHEKTSRKGKTWFYRGVIYMGINTTPKFSSISKNSLETAVEAFQKTVEFDTEKGEFGAQVKQQIEVCWVAAVNGGSDMYSKKSFADAINYFKIAQKIKPQDTTAYIYSLYAAGPSGNTEEVKVCAGKLRELNYTPVVLYSILGKILLNENKLDEALSVYDEGSRKYPDNMELTTQRLNIFMKQGKEVSAINEFKIAANKDPKNKLLWAKLGDIYGQMKNTDSAMYYYNKALEIDPNDALANFNIGIFYNNLAAEKFSGADKTNDTKLMMQLDTEGKEILNKALPYLEKSYQQNPKDVENMQVLMKIYSTLKMQDKAQQMNDAIKAAVGK